MAPHARPNDRGTQASSPFRAPAAIRVGKSSPSFRKYLIVARSVPAEHVSSCVSLLAARDKPHLIDDRETRGKVGNRSSSVREDVFHIWRACQPVRVMHLSDCTIGISREVNQIVR